MEDTFEKEAIGDMIKTASQDLDNIELPKDADNVVVTKIEEQLGNTWTYRAPSTIKKFWINQNIENENVIKICSKWID